MSVYGSDLTLDTKPKHDYKGRSSAPGSLALWTHNLKSISYEPNFRADGCSSQEVHRGVSMGAGVQWQDAYDFAEKHNITVVGGKIIGKLA
ncbi:hypothetical protein AAF712_012596 [Marasmius tenuissimus]|uniref:Uncharacterized protein n=1 Tax=Marasmius tenuissimus TaxID=585030 RepID=A0ABR2ZGW7_9AGAR